MVHLRVKFICVHREDYDARLNQISVTVHFASHYTVSDGFLSIKQVKFCIQVLTMLIISFVIRLASSELTSQNAATSLFFVHITLKI